MDMEKGHMDEIRRLLLRLGTRRFGPPDQAVPAALITIADTKRLERLVEALLDVACWQELLTTP
jgi:hypothetical protein